MAPTSGEKTMPPQGSSPRRSGSCFGRALKFFVLLGCLLAAAGGYGAWRAWRYVHSDLASQIATSLENILERPVKLGDLESVTPVSLRFGPSQVRGTEIDPDRVEAQAVEVQFNLLELLDGQGKLSVEVILEAPDLYIEQEADGTWVNTELNLASDGGPIEIALSELKLQNGNVVAVPYGKAGLNTAATISLEDVSGGLELNSAGDKLTFTADGDVVGQDARLSTSGEVDLAQLAEAEAEQTAALDRRELDRREPTAPTSSISNAGPGPEIAFNIKGRDLLVSDVKQLLENTIPFPESDFRQGRLDADLKVALIPNQDPRVSGKVDFRDVIVKVPQLPQPVTDVRGSVTIKNEVYDLKPSRGRYGPFDITAQGDINLDTGYDLTAKVQPFELPDAVDYLEITLPTTVQGQAEIEQVLVTGPLDNPLAIGKLEAISPVVLDDKVPFKSASSRFRFQDSVIGLQEMRAVPSSGGLITGSGEIVLSGKNNDDGSIQIEANADGLSGDDLVNLYSSQSSLPFRIGGVNAQASVAGPLTAPATQVRFQALKGDYPARGKAVIADGKVDVEDVLISVAGGVARGGGELVGDRLRGRAQLAGVQLNQFSEELRGDLTGDFTFSGPATGLSPETLTAEGIATFSQGISIVNDPLTARVNWEGDRIRVGRATAAGLESSGLVFVSLDGTPAVTGFDLDIDADDLDLATLPSSLGFDLSQFPIAIDISGRGSFDGRLTGSPEMPQVQGDIALRQFQLNDLPFDSSIDGTVVLNAMGAGLKLAGQRDQIAVNLDPEFQPRSFLVKQGAAVARGQSIGPDQLKVNLENFSLAVLDFKPAQNIAAIGDTVLGGTASGEVVVSFGPLTADGSLVVDAPSLGTLKGDRFSGKFSLRDNVAVLQDAALVQGPSRYEVSGRTTLGVDPQFDFQVAINGGDTGTILQTLQWFDFADISRGIEAPTYGTLADLQVTPVGLPDAPLITQLQRFSEIETLVRREALRRREENKIPALASLSGQFNGNINVNGSLSQGLKADFEVLGEDWAWGQYDIDRVILKGDFADDVVTLQPARIEAEGAVLSLTGQFGGDIQQSGQLQAEDVPVALVRNFIELPVALTGQLDMQATVAGTTGNPQAVGSINLANGSINGTPVRTKQIGFNYVNARLGFGGALEVDGPEPVRIAGSVPYAFPFSEVQPETDQLSVNLSVKDEGLAFLDLVTRNQVKWLSGEGEVRLNVGGTLSELKVNGQADFADASLEAQFLPDAPLTAAAGQIKFANDRILVKAKADFSDGQIMADGALPVSRPNPGIQDPLEVTFANLNLNLRGLYRGGASGEVIVRGTSLSPELGGRIELKDGQVLLPDSNATAAAPVGGDRSGSNLGSDGVDSDTLAIAPPSFEQLKLALGKGVKVEQAPLFSFFAEGELDLIGNLETPLLDGKIDLTRGQVNLFTSQFSLATRAENTATFSSDDGIIDPDLQLTMATAVTESSRRRNAFSNTSTSEIQDSNVAELGSLQTVRISAKISGPASQLLDNITLSSSPSRSQAEIASLIGGGFVDTLGRGGDSTLALANLAGSALLGNIQGAINSALGGPVELRLFPTVVESRNRKEQAGTGGNSGSSDNDDVSTVFALGAEVGININNSTSFSALRLLTVDLPTQYNLRYQLNDNLTLRGTTDLQGDNRFVVDYEARF